MSLTLGLIFGMTGRLIHSSEAGVDVSNVLSVFCVVSITAGVDDIAGSTVAAGSSVLVAVMIELLYLGVGMVCSHVNVGVDVTVGMTLVSA